MFLPVFRNEVTQIGGAGLRADGIQQFDDLFVIVRAEHDRHILSVAGVRIFYFINRQSPHHSVWPEKASGDMKTSVNCQLSIPFYLGLITKHDVSLAK